MAAKHSSQRARRPSKKAESGASSRRSDASRSVTLPPPIEAAIDAERRNLQKATSMLGCLVIALEYGYDGDETDGLDYSDVARVVRSIVADSIDRLEPFNLERRPVDQEALKADDTD